MRDSHTVFEGTMASSTVHVTGPSRPLTAEFLAPSDFIQILECFQWVDSIGLRMR